MPPDQLLQHIQELTPLGGGGLRQTYRLLLGTPARNPLETVRVLRDELLYAARTLHIRLEGLQLPRPPILPVVVDPRRGYRAPVPCDELRQQVGPVAPLRPSASPLVEALGLRSSPLRHGDGGRPELRLPMAGGLHGGGGGGHGGPALPRPQHRLWLRLDLRRGHLLREPHGAPRHALADPLEAVLVLLHKLLRAARGPDRVLVHGALAVQLLEGRARQGAALRSDQLLQGVEHVAPVRRGHGPVLLLRWGRRRGRGPLRLGRQRLPEGRGVAALPARGRARAAVRALLR
mmetsp:Transcript_50798/g.157353  ORF Transcript_50798/g.157353 Transcript_50798/m.157353 type:complete len:290 (+) Transcript_50798:591-1460(+)